MSGTIRGVIFDMDGVLCDSEPFIRQAAKEHLRRRFGIEAKDEDFLPFTGMGENRFIGGVAEKYGHSIELPADKIATYKIYLELIAGVMPPLPGAVEFLRSCKASGLKMAVASAADRMKVEGNLRQLGFAVEDFDAVITGSCVTKHKPDPECFLLAAEAMALPAEACLVVEDAVSGCQAAKAAGARCLGITTSFSAETLGEAGADSTAPDLSAVPDEALA